MRVTRVRSEFDTFRGQDRSRLDEPPFGCQISQRLHVAMFFGDGELVSDASFLDHLRLEAGSFYVMDRACMHAARLTKFIHAAAFFVVRPKNKLLHRVTASQDVDEATGVLCDQHIVLTGRQTRKDYSALNLFEKTSLEQLLAGASSYEESDSAAAQLPLL